MFLFLDNYAHLVPDIFGIIGVILVLALYLLLQIGRCKAESLVFSAGNLLGSILVLYSLWFNWNLSSVIIEIAWLFISLYGMIKYFYVGRKNRNSL